MTHLPIPPSLWKALLEFVKPGTYGYVQLNIKDGRIETMNRYDEVRPGKDESRVSVKPMDEHEEGSAAA